MIPQKKKIMSEIKKMQKYNESVDADPVAKRLVYCMSELLRWCVEDTVGWQNPLEEAISHSSILNDELKLKEKDELIAKLEEGISDEIDNLREELKQIKKKNKLLEERDKDFQRNFEADKKIFKNQLKEINELKSKLGDAVHAKSEGGGK